MTAAEAPLLSARMSQALIDGTAPLPSTFRHIASLHGGKVAQIRTKVRHGHRAQVCHWLDEGSPWRMAELEVEEEEEEERGQ